jgi:hypothetical protein
MTYNSLGRSAHEIAYLFLFEALKWLNYKQPQVKFGENTNKTKIFSTLLHACS